MKCLIVGAGPSLEKNLRGLGRAVTDQWTILATDGALIKCLEAGIIPEYVVTLEDYPDYMKFFDNDLVRKHDRKFQVFYSYKTSHQIKQMSFLFYNISNVIFI